MVNSGIGSHEPRFPLNTVSEVFFGAYGWVLWTLELTVDDHPVF
jgi:hypothetical protein